MQLSQESYRARWLVLVTVWSLCAYALFTQAAGVRQYLSLVASVGQRVPPVTTPLVQYYPAFAADAQVWVRHALALQEQKTLRLRYTTIDNAPDGREVHWNSAWAWTIAGAGWMHHLFTGLPLPEATERATLWLPATVLLFLIMVLSAWATRQAGLIAGMIVAFAMACHDRIYEGFFPSYVDHHGLLTVAVFGMVLGAVLMGGGWWQERKNSSFSLLPATLGFARQSAMFSALSGACGLWVSAASTIPPIAIVGLSGLVAVFIAGRSAQASGARFDGSIWRLWGRFGGAASFFFYVLEYFPFHLSFRLEPNHPFHALAWFGGGELIALLGEHWLSPGGQRRASWRAYVLPLVAVSFAPVTILLGGARVLSFTDTFMTRLHNDFIQEFLPMWMTIRSFNAKMIFQIVVVDSAPLLAAIATLTYRRRETPIILWFATAIAGLLTLMAWGQSRWLLNASGAQICLLIVLIGCWTKAPQIRLRWALGLVLTGLLFLPTGLMRVIGTHTELKAKSVAPRDAFSVLNRDIAAAVRASQPEGDILMLASPNASTGIGYYGRFKTLGTLYWENHTGLKAAAAIFAAKTEDEAARLIKAHKLTHIVILSEQNFIIEYYRLLNPSATPEQIRQCFGYKLFFDRVVPQWLQMVPYTIPTDLQALGARVMIFKVNFTQSLPEAIYAAAQTQIAEGELDAADGTLNILLEKTPQFPQPWLRKGEIQIARRNWTEAVRFFLKGISLTSEAERPALYTSAAHALYTNGQHALAIEIYRTALAEKRTPEILAYLAWVLATSTDDSLRNGEEALKLAQEAVKADPNSSTSLSALTAALAETGRFNEARIAAEQAVANAQLRKESAAVPVHLQRLEVIKNGKPLRN